MIDLCFYIQGIAFESVTILRVGEWKIAIAVLKIYVCERARVF